MNATRKLRRTNTTPEATIIPARGMTMMPYSAASTRARNTVSPLAFMLAA
jgi:hypothetical protein